MYRQSACLAAVAAAGCLCAQSHAQELPAGFVGELIVSRHDVVQPTCVAVAPDGRIFIAAARSGIVSVWTPDRGVLDTPFHTFQVDPWYERGVIGLALDPNFSKNGAVYAHISRRSDSGIVRLTTDATNPDVADPASISLILPLSPSTRTSPTGSPMQFGPDGKLYVGMDDRDVPANSQNLTSIHGKVLRVNADGSIPGDNPFYNQTTGACRAIWALGLHDPTSFSFDPATGRLFINDKNNTWQEINDAVPSANFGWPDTEGYFDPAEFPHFTPPVYAYPHEVGRFIAGGVFYNAPGPAFPNDYINDYFFGDIGGGGLKRLDPATGSVYDFASRLNAVDLDVDAQGRLLVLTTMSLIRITYCPADFNADAILDSRDFFDYLDEFLRSRPAADFNTDGVVNSQDFFDYVTAFISGC